jgi:3-oxoacyl-[acyl-carrier protein] reductase
MDSIVPGDFSNIAIGDKARLSKKVCLEDVRNFAALCGDYNPLHMDHSYSQRTRFERPVVHGMLVASYVSTLVGMHLPGPGALWAQQSFRWRAPVFVDDEVDISLVVTHKSEATRTLALKVTAVNQHSAVVMEGEGLVMVLEVRSPNGK